MNLSANNLKKSHFNGIIVLLIIIGFATVLRVPTLFEPWGGDQGVYGYIANGILEGKVPYRDMYTNTGYGLYFTYALFFKLFGNNMMALHIGDLIVSLITVVLVYYLTRLLYGKECAAIGAFLAALFGSGQAFSGLYEMKGAWGTYWQLAQRETFMTLLFTASIFISIIADRKKSWLPYIFIGILMGMAAIFKITAVGILFIFMFFLFYADIFRVDGSGARFYFLKLISIIFGFIIIQLPFLYYFWSHDSLLDMYNAVFVHTSIYAKLSRGNIIGNAFMGNAYIFLENLFLWLFTFASMLYILFNQRTKENLLVITWTIGTLLIIWVQGKFFGYHFILIIAPFSVLTGFGIKKFLKTMPEWRTSLYDARKSLIQTFLWILLFYNLIAFFGNNYDYYRWHALYLSGRISTEQYYEVFNEYPLHLYSFRADRDVANYIKTYSNPGDTIRTVNGGGDTIIHYLTGLSSPTRFTSTWYLFNPQLYDDPLTTKLRQEFIERIKAEKPDYILLVYYTMEEFREIYNDQKYTDIGILMDFINDNYTLKESFRDRRILYKRL